MKLRNLFLLGSIIGGAAYLRDKDRRDAFMSKLARWKDQLPDRLTGRTGATASDSNVGATTSGSYYGGEPAGRGVY